jgi:transcriptional regulator with XRE-family HTH domain
MLDAKKILADNLSALLESRPDISRLDLSKQMKVADGTLGRIKYGTGNPGVEVLEQIARFFRIETWQLLAPDLGKTVMAFPTSAPDSKLVVKESGGLDVLIAHAVQSAVKQVLEAQGVQWKTEERKAG